MTSTVAAMGAGGGVGCLHRRRTGFLVDGDTVVAIDGNITTVCRTSCLVQWSARLRVEEESRPLCNGDLLRWRFESEIFSPRKCIKRTGDGAEWRA